ncbi:MAG TPA: ABC transporter ATP-binding protein [Fimbriimonadaceae bacterium]|nr:ABC transporter ATP-binding protein [Fimbriimonadaceae bacterium]
MTEKFVPDAPLLTEEEALYVSANFRRSAWQAFLFIMPFLRPHLLRLILVCIADIAIIILNFIPPWYGTYLIDRAFPQRDWKMASTIIVLLLATTLLTQLLIAIRKFVYNYVEVRIPLDLRARMYRHIQRFKLETIDATPIGEVLFRLTVDTDRVAHTIYRILPTFTMLVQFALILGFSTYTDPVISLFVLLFIIPWTILFYWVTSISRVLDRRRLYLAEVRDSGIQQTASSFGLVKAFANERLERHKNVVRAGGAQRVAVHGYLFLVPFELVTQRILPYARQTTVFLYLSWKVVNGQMTLGTMVPLTTYLNRLNYPIERMVNFFNWVRQTMVSVERMMKILQTQPSIVDKPGAVRLTSVSGNVEVRDVTFQRQGQNPALSSVSLTLQPGKRVAIIGPSGAGKSTLVNLILRSNVPNQGAVLIDGVDVRDLEIESFLRRIGVVNQETFLFGGTLGDNLRFVKPEATDEELDTVLRSVGLGTFLDAQPNGLNQDLQSGTSLSIGQKQRIGIARSLLSDPRLLILDEPTSALDAASESEVMAVINRLSGDRAVLMVTHRLDTILDFDEIIVLELGRVAGRGTHSELMQTCPLYVELRQSYRHDTELSA